MKDRWNFRYRSLTMLSLILAGEAVFVPPFQPGRYFKSSLLSTFHIDEFQLGQLGAIYGVVAMACYFLGGPIADRISPRKLVPASLLATGLGGLYMSTIPSFRGLYVLFGFWGASTILAFWAPLIRATREWGGANEQGRAFGILDGGRGLAAALVAAIAAYVFGMMVGGSVLLNPAREKVALQTVLYFYASCCFFAAPLPNRTRGSWASRIRRFAGSRAPRTIFAGVESNALSTIEDERRMRTQPSSFSILAPAER